MSTIAKPRLHELGEEQVWIPIKKIEALKPDPLDRSYSRPMAVALAEDFKVNGQLQPCHVRPHPDPRKRDKDCYQQITGLHRIEAQRLAGSDAVLCVIIDADDAEFAAIRDAENSLRANLSKDQQLRAVSRLNAFYEARAARDVEERRLRELEEKAAAIAESQGLAPHDNGEPVVKEKAPRRSRAKPPEERVRAPKGFTDMVAGVLGVSRRTGERLARCARVVESLAPEQREVLFPPGKANGNIGGKDLEALAGLDQEARRKAISLAASGMPWARAIAEHTPPPEELEPAPRPEEDYPDREWLDAFCGKILPKLKNRSSFETEACKWRQFRRFRKKAQPAIKDVLDAWRTRRNPGLFERLILQAWYVAHPNDWIPCGNCDSTGQIPIGSPKGERCPACDGGGFKLKIERWE